MSGIDLYKKDSPRWIYEEPDTLIWAGVGGSISLSILELKRILKRVEKLRGKK